MEFIHLAGQLPPLQKSGITIIWRLLRKTVNAMMINCSTGTEAEKRRFWVQGFIVCLICVRERDSTEDSSTTHDG